MIKYQYKKVTGYEQKKFIENGHTMFEDDVLTRLKRLAYLEEQIKQGELLRVGSVKARYFRVTFSANHTNGSAKGSVLYATNGTYLGADETKADIEKKYGITDVSILHISELNEGDYNYYTTH